MIDVTFDVRLAILTAWRTKMTKSRKQEGSESFALACDNCEIRDLNF